MAGTLGGRSGWHTRTRVRVLLLALVPLAAPSVTSAQTNDVYFRSWAWSQHGSGARAAALAGATAACIDDSTGVETNPATLATLSRSEIALSAAVRRPGHSLVGDTLGTHSSADALTLALKLGPRLSVAVFRNEPQFARITLAPFTAPDGARDEGALSAVTTDVGLALARALGPRLAVGLGITHSHLAFSAVHRRVTPPLPAVLEAGAAGGAERYVATLGLLLSLGRHLRLGLAHRTGASWRIERVAISPLLALTLDAGSPTRIARPATTSLGAQLSLSRRLTLAAQVDHLAAAARSPGVREGYSELFFPRESWQPRASVDLALPARGFSLLLRSGVHWCPRPARLERLSAPAPTPPDLSSWTPPTPAALFERDPEQVVTSRLASRWRFGGGLALVTRPGLRLDLALRTGDGQPALLAGTSWRF